MPKPKFLFVCHGNTERSAAAEIIARARYSDAFDVRSSGVRGKTGSITGRRMRTALSEAGYDLELAEGHPHKNAIRSKPTTKEQLRWADRVFYMDDGNCERLQDQFGDMELFTDPPKAQALSDYVDGIERIRNPGFGQPPTVYLQIVRWIEEALKNLAKEYGIRPSVEHTAGHVPHDILQIEEYCLDDRLEGGHAVNTEFLGGGLAVEGFDPAEELGDANKLEENINSWVLDQGLGKCKGQSPFSSSNWSLFPSPSANYGESGKHNLLVDVRDGSWIDPVLEELKKYLLKDSVPSYVVFHIGGQIGYCEWQIKFNKFFQSVKPDNFPDTKFATRLSASWMPRYNQKPYFWRGGLGRCILDKNGQRANYLIPNKGRAHFTHRIWLLEELGLLNLGVGYIDLHVEQPQIEGVFEGPDISFGTRGNDNRISGRRVRLYFRSGATFQLGFAEDLLNDQLEQEVTFNNRNLGKRFWVAKEPNHFYSDPYYYLNEKKLDNCRRRQTAG